MAVKFVRRDDVRDRLLEKWADAIALARKMGLPFRIPDWERLRNYELEMLMADHFGDDDWIVCEWCPFNGIFCSYKEGASKHDLRTARNNIAAWTPADPHMPMLDKEYHFKLLDAELAKRPDDLGEKQCWGQGVVDHLEEFEAKEKARFESTLKVTA